MEQDSLCSDLVRSRHRSKARYHTIRNEPDIRKKALQSRRTPSSCVDDLQSPRFRSVGLRRRISR
jgi:hypothetical protein